MYSRRLYLSNDFPADIWSLGLSVLRYSLFSRWHLQTSKWSVERCIGAQTSRPDPGWQMLTSLANGMLEFNERHRPLAKDCLKKITVQNSDTTSTNGVKQTIVNTNFLSSQKDIPGVPIKLKPLIPNRCGEAQGTVNIHSALTILEISQTGRKETQEMSLLGLARFLEGMDDMNAQINAIYMRKLHGHVEHAHLAEESTAIFAFHDLSSQKLD